MPRKSHRNVKAAHARSLLLAALERDITVLVERDEIDALEEVLENTGYVSHRNSHTSKDLGRAALLLVAMLDLDDLAAVVYTAAFYRHDGASFELREYHAHAALAQAGIDVLERFLDRLRRTDPANEKPAPAEVH